METERLILRQFTKEQFHQASSFSLEEAQVFFAIETQEGIDKELARLHYRMFECSDGFISWYILEKSSQKVIGDIGLHAWVKKHDRAEIGYLLNKRFHGLGYATEAGKAVIEYGFNKMNLHRIEAYTAKENIASQRVLEKLGFQKEGLKKGHYKVAEGYSDSVVFGIVKPDYILHIS